MKYFVFICLLAVSTGVVAQPDSQYLKTMQANVAALDTTKQQAAFVALTNRFERIAMAERDKWLPYYYAGFCLLEVVSREKDANQLDEQADRADQMLAKADSLNPNNADVYVLRSNLLYARIVVDMMKRGPALAPRAEELLRRASELEPTNLRVNLLAAQLKVFSPESRGGSPNQGCELSEKVLAAYQQISTQDINPHWGKDAAQILVRRCRQLASKNH